MSNFWDEDIANLILNDIEKNGLQVFRNYKTAFEKYAAKELIAEFDSKAHDSSHIRTIITLILDEDVRFLPVIFCSFADECLEDMFKREIPQDIPGGKSSLLTGFGSLSRFSQRIQIAYAFNWMSSDVLQELNGLRRLRNNISHSWDMNLINEQLKYYISSQMSRIEQNFSNPEIFPENYWVGLNTESLFRIRLVWLAGRCYYESHLYASAVKNRVNPIEALYTQTRSKLLTTISGLCIDATKTITGNTKNN